MSDPRLAAFLQAQGAEVLVTAEPGLIRMLAGHAPDIETGPSPFSLPAVVVAPADGEAVLVCSADEAPERAGVESYEGFTTAPLDSVSRAAEAFDRALAAVGARRRFLVDGATTPAG